MSSGEGWYYVKNGETLGPVSQGVVRTELASAGGPSALVWGPGVPEWTEARHVPALGVGTKQPCATKAWERRKKKVTYF